MNISCGIVAGPNSDFLIKNLINICENFSKNIINWYICEDIGYSKNLYPESDNNFTELKNRKNVTFIEPIDSPEISSGGDRHGLGVNEIIKYLKDKEKIILLEPDSFPCCTGWDDIILSKITTKNPIVSMEFEGILDENFDITTNYKENYRCPVVGNLIFLGINPNIFYNLNITFTKMMYNKDDNINKDLEKMGNKRAFKIINDELVNIFELPLDTIVEKETGWRIVYPLKKNGYNSSKLKLYHYGYNGINGISALKRHYGTNAENIKPLDLIFNDNNELLAIHLTCSRNFIKDKHKSYQKILNKIINKYNINKKLFKFI